jgi:hypothetical protein
VTLLRRAFCVVLAGSFVSGCSLPSNLRTPLVVGETPDADVPDGSVGPDVIAPDGAAPDAGPMGDGAMGVDVAAPVDAGPCSTSVVPRLIGPLTAVSFATQFVSLSAQAMGAAQVEFEYSSSATFAAPTSVMANVGADGTATALVSFDASSRNLARHWRAWARCPGATRGAMPSRARWLRVGTRPMSAMWTTPAVERQELDTDGDARTDLAVTAGPGLVRFYRRGGAAISSLTQPTIPSFGRVVTAIGDIDDDGFGDVLVSAPQAVNGTGTAVGAAYIHRGTIDEPSSVALVRYEGNSRTSGFGTAATTLGDLNRDGLADFAVADRTASGSSVFVYLSPHGSMRFPAQTLSQAALAEMTALASGDFDGDGLIDLAVGYGDSASLAGTVLLYRNGGGPMPYVSAPVRLTPSSSGLRLFGQTLAVGAVRNDGAVDLIVGAPGRTDSMPTVGDVVIYANPLTSMTGISTLVAASSAAGEGYGTALSVGGDRDFDGFSELFVLHPGAVVGVTRARSAVHLLDGVNTRMTTVIASGVNVSVNTFTNGLTAVGSFTDATGGRLGFAVTRESTTGGTPVVEIYTYLRGATMWETTGPTVLTAMGSSTFGSRLTAMRVDPRARHRWLLAAR